jgi:hypothetical protein
MRERTLCIALFLLCIHLFSCKEEVDEPKPTSLLTEEKMAEVLTDVRLLEGVYAGDFQRVDTSEYGIGAYYEQVFTKHEITRVVFVESYSYYAHHPEMMLRVETEVSRKLESMSVPAAP